MPLLTIALLSLTGAAVWFVLDSRRYEAARRRYIRARLEDLQEMRRHQAMTQAIEADALYQARKRHIEALLRERA